MYEDKRILGPPKIEDLRRLVYWCDWQNEEFIGNFTADELIKLFNACKLSAWDYFPDQWTSRQVSAAIKRDEVPDWHEEGRPKNKGETPEAALARLEKEAARLERSPSSNPLDLKVSVELKSKVLAAAKDRRMIDAIKILRVAQGMTSTGAFVLGIREARDQVVAWMKETESADRIRRTGA